GGADHPGRLVQQEIARRAARLEQPIVQFDAMELTDLAAAVGFHLAVHPHAPAEQQQAYILAAVSRQIAEEAVEAHGGGWRLGAASYSIGGGRGSSAAARAQSGHRQATPRASTGRRSSALR